MNKIIAAITDFKNYTWEDWALWIVSIALVVTIIYLAGGF